MSAIKTKIAGGLMVKTEQESGGMVKTEQESGRMVKTEQESGRMVKTEQESGRRGERSEFQGPVKQKIPDFRLQTNFKQTSNMLQTRASNTPFVWRNIAAVCGGVRKPPKWVNLNVKDVRRKWNFINYYAKGKYCKE